MTAANVRSRPVWRRLEVKLAAAIWMLVGIGLLVLGAIDAIAARRLAFEQIGLAQQARASEVGWAVLSSLNAVRSQVQSVSSLPWEVTDWIGVDERRLEYQRIVKMVPAVDRIALAEQGHSPTLVVSRREPDRLPTAARSAAATQTHNLPDGSQLVFYANEFEPMLRLTVADGGSRERRTLVDINLGRLATQVRRASPAFASGTAYVADENGTVLLHRDASVMVQRLSLADRSGFVSEGEPPWRTVESRGLRGHRVLMSSVAMESLPWRVYVEQPYDQAMQPVWEVVRRAIGLTWIWLVVVAAFGWYVARRIAKPIRLLAQGAASLAEGKLDTRIESGTADEVGELAERFNTMASTLQDTITHQEQRIAEKTQALERANRNKTEFLANMSHELRTPLNGVILAAEMLVDKRDAFGLLTPDQERYLRQIHGSGLHLLSLINDLLDLSKVEAGQMELEPMLCDVADFVERSLVFVRSVARARGLALLVSIEPPGLTCWADPRRLLQILTNLIANAVKFTDSGSVQVQARMVAEEVWIEVRDTGRGIAPDDLPYLCEPFRRLRSAKEGSEDRAIEGTGLGLALVRQLTQRHGGTLEWESELGVSSLFRVRLPNGKEA
jgi:signal transduction histidine kinase